MAERLRAVLHARPCRGLMVALIAALGLGFAAVTAAKDAPPVAQNEQIEQQMMDIASELRCLVCQNQTIADSHASLAEDLRQEIREMVAKGQNKRQVVDYMTARYGDFVLYRPPFKASTALLWIGPGVLVVIAISLLALTLRRRQKLGDEAFEPDDENPESREENR